jgi:ribosome silencing factor RsfS/YbeB/iojap
MKSSNFLFAKRVVKKFNEPDFVVPKKVKKIVNKEKRIELSPKLAPVKSKKNHDGFEFGHDLNMDALYLLKNPSRLLGIDEVVQLLKEQKGMDLVVMDMKGKVAYCQYIILVTGMSHRHMKSLAKCMTDLMMKKRPSGSGSEKPYIEGADCDDWMIVDGSNIILHVFSPEGRNHWDLDRKFAFEVLEDSQMPPEELEKYIVQK